MELVQLYLNIYLRPTYFETIFQQELTKPTMNNTHEVNEFLEQSEMLML